MRLSVKTVGLAAALLVIALRVHPQGANEVVRLDPALDQIISTDTKVEKLAGGFGFVEGPVWVRSGGYLLFSDIPANAINKWTPDGKVSVFLKPSGFTGSDPSDVGSQNNNGQATVTLLGSNGVTLDRQGRIVFCTHGDRDVVRIEKDGKRTVLADRFEGKRLNSPNDLVFKSDGALYFTEPTAGLRKRDDYPKKELPFNGVYLLRDGKLQGFDKTYATPNGIARAPGEKYLYVNDTTLKLIIRYELRPEHTIGNGQEFIDMSADTA